MSMHELMRIIQEVYTDKNGIPRSDMRAVKVVRRVVADRRLCEALRQEWELWEQL